MSERAQSKHEPDLEFAGRVLAANNGAAYELRARYQSKLVAVLCSRGASRTEAEDLVADLWSDCFATPARGRALLEKYQGRSSLESWLITVAMHRLVDLKRKQSFRVEVGAEPAAENFFERQADAQPTSSEEPLLNLLRQAIRAVFAKADAEEILMLKLVYLHQITQRELGRMWGWHESKISRTLEVARSNIAREILLQLKQSDPWLELRWEDFVELCERSADLFPWPGKDNSQTPLTGESKKESEIAVEGAPLG